MGVMAKKNGAQPVFDYSQWGYKDQRDIQTLSIRFQRKAQQLDEADPAMPDDEFETLLAAYETLRQDIDFHMVTKHIVSVPPEWIIESAPAPLDWSQPDTLGWVRADRMQALREAAEHARSPEGLSGE
jgi:hypothetical protein